LSEAEGLFKDIDPTSLQTMMMTGGSDNQKQEIMKKLIPLVTK